MQYEETKERLERLGIDVSRYRPPPPLQPFEQFCTSWPTNAEYQAFEATKEHRRRAGPAPADPLQPQRLIRPGIGRVTGVR
jgi:hypothetical protein